MGAAIFCQHCGRDHPEEFELCPRTGGLMGEPGLCGGRVDRYFVERLLGIGGCGAVYRARHVRTEGMVALKVLKPELSADGPMLERFMREARTAAMLGDERLVRVLDAEITPEGLAFIAMELLEGDDLQQLHQREGPLHAARVVGLMCQVLEGLEVAHAKQVIHRDMKPGNVFVLRKPDANGIQVETVKVLDFGISKMQDAKPLTAVGTSLGTPSYMAYEQLFDSRDVDARTDVYAVAAMTYELLSSQRAFDAPSFFALIQKVRIGEYQPLRTVAPGLPVPLVAVVEKGLSKKRERRWQSAREFAAALSETKLLLRDAPLLPSRESREPAQDAQRDIATLPPPRRS